MKKMFNSLTFRKIHTFSIVLNLFFLFIVCICNFGQAQAKWKFKHTPWENLFCGTLHGISVLYVANHIELLSS